MYKGDAGVHVCFTHSESRGLIKLTLNCWCVFMIIYAYIYMCGTISGLGMCADTCLMHAQDTVREQHEVIFFALSLSLILELFG